MAVKLGDLLVKSKLISNEQLQEALKEVQSSGMKLGEALVKLGYITEDDITETLSAQFGVPSINLSHFEIDPAVLKLVAADVARKYNILPVNKTGATITIAMADPTNVFAMDDIKFMTGYNVEPVVASETAVLDAISRYYAAPSASRAVRGRKASGVGQVNGETGLRGYCFATPVIIDRFNRQAVLILADLLRAALVASLTCPTPSFWPYSSARAPGESVPSTWRVGS